MRIKQWVLGESSIVKPLRQSGWEFLEVAWLDNESGIKKKTNKCIDILKNWSNKSVDEQINNVN